MTKYWIYEDDPSDYIRIHAGSCRWVNNRKTEMDDPRNRWYDPFDTLDDAIAFARARRRGECQGMRSLPARTRGCGRLGVDDDCGERVTWNRFSGSYLQARYWLWSSDV